jgi:GH43 family beta-xylosidase
MTNPTRVRGQLLALAWLALSGPACQRAAVPGAAVSAVRVTTFQNPLLPVGPDPFVSQKDGFYYYTHTTGNNLTLWKTATMSGLPTACGRVVWTPSAQGQAAGNLWAPELYSFDGKWYLYYTAGPAGHNLGHQRIWVLENPAADPTTGTWTDKSQLASPAGDFWAIDGTVLEQQGRRYLIWSGHNGTDDVQRLYISQLRNPWTLTGPRVELSHPEYPWETVGPPYVNEGPEILQRGGRTFLVYSASFCGTDSYALGMLTASRTADPLLPASWTKSAQPVFAQRPASGAYGTGHNSFFRSKDGQEDWIIYHANAKPDEGCENHRSPRMQKFTWNADGTPHFGVPVAIDSALAKPTGE